MRLRLRPRLLQRLFLLGALTVALVAFPAAAVSATEEPATEETEGEGPAGHAEEECIEILETGGSIDDCQEAPNPLLPEWNEIIWGSIFFGVVLFAMIKYAVPALRQGLQTREDKIRGDLEGAEAARLEAQRMLEEYRAQLANARSEADRIIEESRQSAEQVRADVMARAEQDTAEVRARAQADLEASVNRMRADLQGDVSRFAVELAERVVERNLDRDAQQALIERYISEVGGLGSSN